jgi:predicted nucleic acid-binding protein
MKIIFLPPAKAEFTDATSYYNMQSEGLGYEFAAEVSHIPTDKDDHLLELAIASGTKLIVTHNTKDFKGVEKFGIRSITPKAILEEIL